MAFDKQVERWRSSATSGFELSWLNLTPDATRSETA
jgi:hypothetical protein